MRCTSGHSIDVDTTLLTTPLLAFHVDAISCITHVTKSLHLASMFRSGVVPGGTEYRGGGAKRNASYFCPYHPDDPRNIIVRRDSADDDA
eukprot:15913657-Heterocapsa_arctica.AAC.1